MTGTTTSVTDVSPALDGERRKLRECWLIAT